MQDEQEDRIAVLLSLMGSDVSGPLLAQLPEAPRNRVQKLVDQYQNQPVDDEDVDEVIDEFMRMLKVANQTSGKSENKGESEKKKSKQPVAKVEEEEEAFIQSDDAVADLLRLEPFQIAGALKSERPQAIALVLTCLPPAQAGEALQILPPELQGEVFLLLKSQPKAPPKMLERIVRSTVQKGCVLDDKALSDPEEEIYKNLAELLRAMGKTDRTNVIDCMKESDPEAVERLTKMLFIFDDVLNLTDRCIQKILGEVDTGTIAKAVKNAEPELREKFLNNLSKRAKATLMEEMEFMDKMKQEEEEEAREVICKTMAQLDQACDLETMDS